jgi:hypothetical protein
MSQAIAKKSFPFFRTGYIHHNYQSNAVDIKTVARYAINGRAMVADMNFALGESP